MATFRQGQIDEILNYDRSMNRIILDRTVAQVSQFNDEKARPRNKDIKFEALLGQLVDKLKATIAEALQTLTSKQYPSINLVNFNRLMMENTGDDGMYTAPRSTKQKQDEYEADYQLEQIKKKQRDLGFAEAQQEEGIKKDDEEEDDDEMPDLRPDTPPAAAVIAPQAVGVAMGRPHLGIGRHFLKPKPRKVRKVGGVEGEEEGDAASAAATGEAEGEETMGNATGAKTEEQFTKSVENSIYDIVSQYNGIIAKLLEATQQDGLYQNRRTASASMIQTYANILKGLIEPLRHFLSEASLVRNPTTASLFNMVASMIELIDNSPPFQKLNIEAFRQGKPDYQGLASEVLTGSWEGSIATYNKFLKQVDYDLEKLKRNKRAFLNSPEAKNPLRLEAFNAKSDDTYERGMELKKAIQDKLKYAEDSNDAGLDFNISHQQDDAKFAKLIKKIQDDANNFDIDFKFEEVRDPSNRTMGAPRIIQASLTNKKDEDKLVRDELVSTAENALQDMNDQLKVIRGRIARNKTKMPNPDDEADLDRLVATTIRYSKTIKGFLDKFPKTVPEGKTNAGKEIKKFSGPLLGMKEKLDGLMSQIEQLQSGELPPRFGPRREGEGKPYDSEEEEEESEEEEVESDSEEEDSEPEYPRRVGRGDGKPDLKAKMDDIASAKDQEERTYKYAHLRGREEGKAKAAMARTMKLLGSGPVEDAAMAAKEQARQAAVVARQQAMQQAAREQARQAAMAAKQAAMSQGQVAAGKPLADYLGSKRQTQYNSMGRPISNDDEIHNKERKIIRRFQDNVPIQTNPVGKLYPFDKKAPESKYDFVNELMYNNSKEHPTHDARGADISLLQGPIGGPTTEKQLPMKKNKSQRVVRTPQEALQAVLNGGAKNGALRKIVFDDEANDMFDEDSGAQNGFIPEDKDAKFKFPEIKKKGEHTSRRR